jgi:hypothetical protein
MGMTDMDDRLMQATARAMVAQNLTLLAARLLASHIAAEAGLRGQQLSAIERQLAHMRHEMSMMTFPEIHPVQADAWAQIAVEQLDELSREFLCVCAGDAPRQR